MKDIRLNVNFWDHWKTISLRDQLGLEGVESLQRLWCFAAVNKPSGHLNGLSAKAIEMASRWTGAPGVFVETLERLTFLQHDETGYQLHDWKDHQAFIAGFEERSNQAKAAIAKRWDTKQHTERSTVGITPSPLLSSPTHTLPKNTIAPGFDIWWVAYPKKVAKADAVKAFNKLHPDETLLALMLGRLETFKATDLWQKEGGKFVPNPATWLNGKRWEDEIAVPQKGKDWNARG